MLKGLARLAPAFLLASALASGGSTPAATSSVIPGYSAGLKPLSGNYCEEIFYFDGAKIAAALLSPGSYAEFSTVDNGKSGEDSMTIVPLMSITNGDQALAAAVALAGTGFDADRNEETFLADSEGAADGFIVGAIPQQAINSPFDNIATMPAPSCDFSTGAVQIAPGVPIAHVELVQGALTPAAYTATDIYDSGCAAPLTGHHVSWHGCYTRTAPRDSDPNHYYSLDRSSGAGHGTFWASLTYGNSQQNYNSHGLVVVNQPEAEESGDCHKVDLSLEFGITPKAKVSDSFQACKSRIEVHWGEHQFHATWAGRNGGGTVAESNEDLVRIDDGYSAGFKFTIHDGWSYW